MQYFGTRLSDNLSRREPEGYLICLNVPVARTGTQEYLPSELGLPPPDDRLIPVLRPAEEVFSPACMASFEGMPVTDDHPAAPEGVTVDNSRYLEKGHVQNVRRGAPPEEDLLLADLIIKDPRLIEKILSGKREISCGYNYVLSEENGTYFQREIRGNHVAVVDSGRAGPRVSIRDQKKCPLSETASLRGREELPRRSAGSDPGRISSPLPSPSFAHPHPTSGGPSVGAKDERSTQMNRKNHWRAKLMARMARDGDVESLAEMITELTEAAEAPAPEAAAAAAQPTPTGIPAEEDPLVSAVMEAVESASENAGTAGGAGIPGNAGAAGYAGIPGSAGTAGSTESAEEAENHPLLTDCGPDILAALNRIIELISGLRAGDCGIPDAQQDQDPEAAVPPEEAAVETVEETAEALAEAAARVLGAAAAPAEAPASEDDPVEALVADLLEGNTAEAAGEAAQEEILSTILEPEEESFPAADEDDPAETLPAEDVLRAALAAFRPQLQRMSPRDRQRFNADVAARMRKLTARSGKDRNPYAAIRGASARPRDDRALGRKIMAARNANHKP